MVRPPEKAPSKPPLTDRLSAWVKVVLLLAIPLYLIGDLAAGYMFADARREARDKSCYRFEDEAEELARQRNLPVTILGKFDHFVHCGSIQEISFLGGKISNERVIAKEQEKSEKELQTAALLEEASVRIKELTATSTLSPRQTEATRALTENIARAQEELVQDISTREANIARLETQLKVTPPSGLWLLVAGADQSDAAAADQVAQLRRILERNPSEGFKPGPVEIRLIRSWKRSVVLFESREEAERALAVLKKVLPYGGYVRSQAAWCPDLAAADPIAGITTMRCES